MKNEYFFYTHVALNCDHWIKKEPELVILETNLSTTKFTCAAKEYKEKLHMPKKVQVGGKHKLLCLQWFSWYI